MPRVPAIYNAPSWDSARRTFGAPGASSAGIDGAGVPAEIRDLSERMGQWTRAVAAGFDTLPRARLSRRLKLAGRLVGTGLHLRAELDTAVVLAWIDDSATDPSAAAAFVEQRRDLTDRLGDLAVLGADVFQAAEFALPSQVGRKAWSINLTKLTQLLGGRRIGRIELGLAGTIIGLLAIARQERRLLASAIGRRARAGDSIAGIGNRRLVDAANRRAAANATGPAPFHLDHSRGEHVRAARSALRRAGVRRRQANRIVDQALILGHRSCGKPWRGLIQLRELIVHAGLDPRQDDFIERLGHALTGPVVYSHTPGREWLVRDYGLARELLKIDGKTSRTTQNVAVSQAGASIAPGVLANNAAMLGLAAHYMKPIEVYLNAVVAQSGDDHRRHKGVFQQYFRKGEVLDRVAFIEATVAEILDGAEAVARANDGRFDFTVDVAAHFPIRIICEFMGIPAEDAATVRHWSEASVRALDAAAGISLTHLTEGNRSAVAFTAYIGDMLRRARAGEPIPGIIGAVAAEDDLTETELISNIAGITFAGFETTTGLLALGFRELLTHPEQWQHLRAALVTGAEVTVSDTTVPDRDLRWYLWADDERRGRLTDPAHIERYHVLGAMLARSTELTDRLDRLRAQEAALTAAVDEFLRWTAPGSVIPLTLEEDVVVEGVAFSRGQTVTVDVAGANRSGCPFGPGRFERVSGEFDVSRTNNTNHLSFGVTHVCMGAELAMENARRMIEAVLRRFGDLQLDGVADEADGDLFFGLNALPVRSAVLADQADVSGGTGARR